jgi:hypothetical protein
MAAFTPDNAGYKGNMMLLGEIYWEAFKDSVNARTVWCELSKDLGETTD